MTSKETFTHYQPLGNSDPAHTATAPGGLSAKAPAMTPLMLDTATRKLVAWDGTTDGAAVVPACQAQLRPLQKVKILMA